MVKKALCIGINYPGTSAELAGCINDAALWRKFFESHGYSVTLLVDDGSTSAPTRENIFTAIDTLVQDLQDGDNVALTYSGHGSHVYDKSGDEADHRDETICPSDFLTAGMIKDDELRERLLVPLPANCAFLGMMDCCHSGTTLDLQYKLIADTESGRGAGLHDARSANRGKISHFIKLPVWKWHPWYGYVFSYGIFPLASAPHFNPVVAPAPEPAVVEPVAEPEPVVVEPVAEPEPVVVEPVAEPDPVVVDPVVVEPVAEPEPTTVEHSEAIKCVNAVMFSGSKDIQTAADAHMGGKPVGAFTYCMHQVLQDRQTNIRYNLTQVNKLLRRNGFEQRSEASMSRKEIQNITL